MSLKSRCHAFPSRRSAATRALREILEQRATRGAGCGTSWEATELRISCPIPLGVWSNGRTLRRGTGSRGNRRLLRNDFILPSSYAQNQEPFSRPSRSQTLEPGGRLGSCSKTLMGMLRVLRALSPCRPQVPPCDASGERTRSSPSLRRRSAA